MTGSPRFAQSPVNVRVKISALWASMLFVFAYVDLFSLYRADIRGELETGRLGGFAVNQSFLLATTAYVVVPALMVFLTLILRPGVSRIANIVLAVVYALTVIAGAVGDSNHYYVFGSAIEVVLLATIAYSAWTWPRGAQPTSTSRPSAEIGDEERCQSCGMRLAEGFFGTDADGRESREYCRFCYLSGAFTRPDLTVDDMIVLSIANMTQEAGISKERATEMAHSFIPTLKRWRA